MNKSLTFIYLFFSTFSFCVAQKTAAYYLDKDLSDSNEKFEDLSFIHHKGYFIADTIDLVNDVDRYVYRFESLSGLKWINPDPKELFNEAFTIELVFKLELFDEQVDLIKVVFHDETTASFAFQKELKTSTKEYVHYLLTRKGENSPIQQYANGKLIQQNNKKEGVTSAIREVVFFGKKGKKCQGNVALIRVSDHYFTEKEVVLSIAQLPNVLRQREDYPPITSERLKVDFSDANTGVPMKAHLKVLNGKSELFNSATAETSFEITYVKNITYKLIIKPEEKDYMTTIENITITETPTSRSIKIKPVSVGDKFELHNIQFKQSEPIMVDGAEEELDYLVALMMDNPKMELLIAGHTDGIGNDELNTELSRLRAMVVEEYLVEKGVERDRLFTEGYGGRQPIATNKLNSDRKLNRRVEFTILKL